ncbi:hypothetical protein ALC62_06460 [Cyphomyrmex costatus]|uniref:Uncharacterized protein n=1 Tax=Cyphomyrmex costatus TaxID=456900 RepID=A0A195CPM5_9HYME|nr:hypothetical protein ALC62_06460 [Cyphomyrmex costatus]
MSYRVTKSNNSHALKKIQLAIFERDRALTCSILIDTRIFGVPIAEEISARKTRYTEDYLKEESRELCRIESEKTNIEMCICRVRKKINF